MRKSMSFSQRYERRLELIQNADSESYNLDRQLGAITQGNRKYRTWQTRIKEADNIIDNVNAEENNIRSLERYYRDLSNELETNRSLARDDSRKSYAQWHLERVGQKIKDLKDSSVALQIKIADLNRLDYSQPQPASVYAEARPVVAVLTPQTKGSLEDVVNASVKTSPKNGSRLLAYAAGIGLALASCIQHQAPRIYVAQNGVGDSIGIGLRVHANMIEEMKARNAPFTGSPKDYEFTTKTAAINVKEPLAVSHESDRPVADLVAPVVTVAEESSSLIPDAETIARYEALRAREQHIGEKRKEFGRRMYESIKSGFAKIGDALKGLDAKVASAIPSVSPMPVYEAPAVVSVPEIIPIITTHAPSKRECGIITVAREYGLLNQTVEAPVQRSFVNGAGDALGTRMYLSAQQREQKREVEPVKPSVKPAPITNPGNYDNKSWQHEPSRKKEVLIKTNDPFNPLAVQIEIGNSGIINSQPMQAQVSPGVIKGQDASVQTYEASLSQDPAVRKKQIQTYNDWLTERMKTFKPTAVNGHY